jgi:iron-sulfur cluster repair protein YtfE (RIC family)
MNKPDVTMMYAVHNAFRRDLARMRSVATDVDKAAVRKAIANCWATCHRYLTIHHTAEDEMLWPPIRSHFVDAAQVQCLLDDMIDEHAALDPLQEQIDGAVRQGSPARLDGLSLTSPKFSPTTSITRSPLRCP